MAVRGAAPKTNKLGHTPNAEWTEVLDTPYTGPSPELPKLPNRKKWNDLVVQWWEQVRQMPHCTLWAAGDWQFALETALFKDALWREYAEGECKSTLATEIRRREAMLGTTVEARRQLRIRYLPVADDEDAGDVGGPVQVVEQQEATGGVATVTPIGDRRARLTRAS